MNTTDLLLEFSDKAGVPGLKPAENYAVKLLEKYGEVEVSALGSIICTIQQPKDGQPHILLDAHIDEIGLVVTHIEENGFLRVGQIGGTDPRLLAASRVTVHTQKEEFVGVICSTPPHLSGGEEKENLTADKVYIDVGLSGEDAKLEIQPGDRITFHHSPARMLNSNVSAKALDDRSGCVSIIKALDFLDEKPDCGLTVMFSNLEEIGGQGAKTGVFQINPTHALVVDVGFAKVPNSKEGQARELGGGPMIGFAPILSTEISNSLVELAKNNGIPYQYDAMGGKTGTNADSIVTSQAGVETALLSIPQRYMHMPIEMVNVEDLENTGRLIAAWIQDISKAGAVN